VLLGAPRCSKESEADEEDPGNHVWAADLLIERHKSDDRPGENEHDVGNRAPLLLMVQPLLHVLFEHAKERILFVHALSPGLFRLVCNGEDLTNAGEPRDLVAQRAALRVHHHQPVGPGERGRVAAGIAADGDQCEERVAVGRMSGVARFERLDRVVGASPRVERDRVEFAGSIRAARANSSRASAVRRWRTRLRPSA
jgi:hypothetical protein